MKKPSKNNSVPSKPLNNPNGANQWRADPRQSDCILRYLDPKSATFGNMYLSAIKAGFGEVYSQNIISQNPKWLSRILDQQTENRSRMLMKAERNLEELADLPSKVQGMGAFGPLYEKKKTKVKTKKGRMRTKTVRVPVMVFASPLLKLKNDASQFIAERLGKKTYGVDVPQGNQTLVLMVTGETAKRYGIAPHADTKPSSE